MWPDISWSRLPASGSLTNWLPPPALGVHQSQGLWCVPKAGSPDQLLLPASGVQWSPWLCYALETDSTDQVVCAPSLWVHQRPLTPMCSQDWEPLTPPEAGSSSWLEQLPALGAHQSQGLWCTLRLGTRISWMILYFPTDWLTTSLAALLTSNMV